jgi:hypothetical protein
MGQQQGGKPRTHLPFAKALAQALARAFALPKLHSFIFSPRYQYKGFVGHVNKA